MKRVCIFVLAMITLLINSCVPDERTSEFVIHGHFTNAESNKVVLEELGVKDLTAVDSAVIDNNGEFTVLNTPDDIGLYILRIGKNNFITLLIDKGEKLQIQADALKMAYTYNVEGSEGSRLLMNYYKHTVKNKIKVDSLGKIFQLSQGLPEFLNIRMKLDSSYREIFKDQQEYVKHFISNNPTSLASLVVLNKHFGRGYVLSEKEHFEYFQKIDSGLMAEHPNNKHAIDHHERVSKILMQNMERELADEKLQSGKPAPEISVNDSNGIPLPLSSTLGKITLIYFWAGESAPCRKINPKLNKLYKELKNKEFEIYGVSLDRNPNVWKAAVKLDGLKWIQLSDQKGYASPLVKLYNLPEELPYFYLIDKEGSILLRGNKSDFEKIKKRINIELSLNN